MGVHVLVVYQPLPGKQAELEAEVAGHVPLLRRLGLATDRPSVALRAEDGTVVEYFEWTDHAAIDRAHSHPEVLQMWKSYEQCCTYGTLAALPNSSAMFPEFGFLGSY